MPHRTDPGGVLRRQSGGTVLTLATYLYAVCSQLLIVEFVRTRTINICNRQYCVEPTGWLTDEARVCPAASAVMVAALASLTYKEIYPSRRDYHLDGKFGMPVQVLRLRIGFDP